MALFLLACMPLLAALVVAAERSALRDLVWLALAGTVAALPCQALLLLCRGALGASFRPGRLYASALLADHLLPLAMAAACYALIHVLPFPGRRGEGLGSSAEPAVYLALYFAVLSVGDYLRERGELGAHILFLLPLLRIFSVALYARGLPAVVQARGWRKALPVAAMAAWPLVGAFEGLWARQGRVSAAALLVAGLLFLLLAAYVLPRGLPGAGRGRGVASSG